MERGPASTLSVLARARPFLSLALLIGALYLPWIGAIPLDGTLEGNRLEAAREMLQSGDWMVPHLGGAVYLAKPPLHPWTLAFVARFFGDVSVGLGRTLSALSALATCALVLAWGRRELGTRTGAIAAFVLGGSVLCAEKAVRAELESELMLFSTLALLAFWEAGRAEGRGRVLAVLVAGLALGAAVLVKGPPPLIVFAGAALGAALPRQRRRAYVTAALGAFVLALAVALAWVVPLCASIGFERAWQDFHLQFVERITQAGATNVEAPWFYGPALLVALLPATLLAPGLALVCPHCWPRCWPHCWPGRAGESERSRARLAFLWGSALLPVVFFSFSSGKETRYLLPVLPAWSLLLAWGWTRARVMHRFAGWRRGLARTVAIVTWAAPFVWLVAGMRLFPENLGAVLGSASGALLARGGFVWSARARRPAFVLATLVALVLSAKLAWAGTVLAKKQREVPVAAAGRSIAARLRPEERWILVGPYRSWWHFLVDHPCVNVRDWSEVRAARESSGACFVLAPAQGIPAAELGVERVDGWVVDGDAYALVKIR